MASQEVERNASLPDAAVAPSVNLSQLSLDILPHILRQLDQRVDWHTCALVSRTFNRFTTPLLYSVLDSDVIASKHTIAHACHTILARPELASYVRFVTETGTVHRSYLARSTGLTQLALRSLSLCHNIISVTWVDDVPSTDAPLSSQFLSVLKTLPIRDLTVRTHIDIGDRVWEQMIQLTDIRRLSIWCAMEGRPRFLQGWSERLGSSLIYLELGSCNLPPTLIITTISHLPLLQSLRIKGVPSGTMFEILTLLPQLHSLDTEYYHSTCRRRSVPYILPTLRNLTVRTSSLDTVQQTLWRWILEIVPHPGLDSLTLNTESIIPRMFILDLAAVHRKSLKYFSVTGPHMSLMDLECVCYKFPELESVMCPVASPDIDSIFSAVSRARNLRSLKLDVSWASAQYAFQGRWVFEDGQQKFQVVSDFTTPKRMW
ncbi:hypothetical protein FISHEDRAFT_63477 [Fistulina hepatica ATCC 64428]|uniref:Uncharacterized protein n=1 Tax=Fistulina hepatica ATCC 64428 TaxID=1128425 RepID=A0A0D7AN79_9AGAR|nr:hypothetical protein FISHEDRAFT_63477 [Fistulina hepatica ATCC 64428]